MPDVYRILNATGRTRFCEECGTKMLPGEVHECRGAEESETAAAEDCKS